MKFTNEHKTKTERLNATWFFFLFPSFDAYSGFFNQIGISDKMLYPRPEVEGKNGVLVNGRGRSRAFPATNPIAHGGNGT